MKPKIDVNVSWHEPTGSWVAVSADPPARASGNSPRIAVRRLRATLGARTKIRVAIALPAKASAAVERYQAAAADLAERQQRVLDMQIELAQMLIESCGLNRSQSAVVVGMSHSYLARLLDGKRERDASSIAPVDPLTALAEFVADERIGADRFVRKPKRG